MDQKDNIKELHKQQIEQYLKKLERSITQNDDVYINPPTSEIKSNIKTPKPSDHQNIEKSPNNENTDEANTLIQSPPPIEHKQTQIVIKDEAKEEERKVSPVKQIVIGEDDSYALFDPGNILKMEDGSLFIFDGPVKGKEYDLTLFLLPDGRLEPRGICTFAYECEKLGHLPKDQLSEVKKMMSWDRDQIIFHLDKFEYCQMIPFPQPITTNTPLSSPPPPTAPRIAGRTQEMESRPRPSNSHTPIPSDIKPSYTEGTKTPPRSSPSAPSIPSESKPGVNEDNRNIFQKGRVLSIKMGDREWRAIYWGKDALGQLVAHQTHGDWSLIHMDLDRFNQSIEYENLLSPDEIKKIEIKLAEKYSQ